MVNHTAPVELPDILLPPAISTWPPAVGWLLVYLAVVAIMVLVARRVYRYWFRTRAKRAAYRALCEIEINYQRQARSDEAITEISSLLRRIALAYYPRKDIAGLHGDDWLAFLDKAGKTTFFSTQAQALISAPYQKRASIDLEQLFKQTKVWIKAGNYV